MGVGCWVEHEAEHTQPSLPGVPATGVPRQALAYLQAARRCYEGVTDPDWRPTNPDIAAAHAPRLEARTWDRRKHDLRCGKWGGRDWIEVWPPPQNWHPSWEQLLADDHVDVNDGELHLVVDETYDSNGKMVARRVIRILGHLGAAAALFPWLLLDGSDGHIDGVFAVGCLSNYLLHIVGHWAQKLS